MKNMMKNNKKNTGDKANGEKGETRPVENKFISYWILALVRIVLTLLPQTGYIHPDEYFQSIEVIAGHHFDIDVYKPWEFNVSFPLRTASIPQIIVGVPYSFLNLLSPYYFHLFGKSLKNPYTLILLPRLVMCSISFVSDYCLYKICCIYSQKHSIRLITYASSYIMLTYATRTFSNTIELVLTSLLLYYVSHCMAYSEKVVLHSDHLRERYEKASTIVERVKYYKLRMSLPTHSLNNCLILATITVVGIFNRPTFVVFAFPPIFFWLHRGLGSKSVGFADFHIRFFAFVFCGVPAALFFIVTDSFYFGYLTLGEILNMDISINNFVVTPLNFLKYNLDVKNVASHGLHPRFLHFVINVPLLFNVLGIIGLLAFAKMVYSLIKGRWLDLPRVQSIECLMTASFIVPIAALSIIPHQEPRFIIPTLLPLVFLHAQTIARDSATATIIYTNDVNDTSTAANKRHLVQRNTSRMSKLQLIYFIWNLSLTFFYGFGHQGGVFPLTWHFATELRAKPYLTHIHLYTSYTHSIPTALLQLRNTKTIYTSSDKHKYRLAQDLYLYEEGSKDVGLVYESIASQFVECERKWSTKRVPYRLYYALPITLFSEFENYAMSNISKLFNYRTVTVFYPHISTEKLPSFDNIAKCLILNEMNACLRNLTENISSNIYKFFHSFGLLLLKIEMIESTSDKISR